MLVACSGGPDSVALLHVLHRLAPELDVALHAASVDHGIRPDAHLDVETAGALASRLEVPFTALRIAIPTGGASLQGKARRARYDALFAEAERVGASVIAVGHTLDDQAETVLARLLRGSGVLGLAGIDPKRADGVIRPLIDCPRHAVHAYVAEHELPFRVDPSNDDPAYERVRLRQTVLPLLAAEDPSVAAHLARVADDARELRALAHDAAADLLAAARTDPTALDAALLRSASAPVRASALALWVRDLTGTPAARAHLDALARTLGGRGETLLPSDVRVRLDGAALRAWHAPDAPTRSKRARAEPE